MEAKQLVDETEPLQEQQQPTAEDQSKEDSSPDRDPCSRPLSESNSSDVGTILGLLVLTLSIRLWSIESPSVVVFDEIHFGGFAGRYIKGEFFFDLHPPLGKLILALTGYLNGWDGDYPFDSIGQYYINSGPNGIPYYEMRVIVAVFGSLLPAFAYYLLRGLTFSTGTSLLGAFFVVFDNAQHTQSRFILLDAFLLAFMMMSVTAFVHFRRSVPFSILFWSALFMTGFSLGCLVSVKLAGLFSLAVIGAFAVVDLWFIAADGRNSWRRVMAHLGTRFLGLVVVPIAIYIGVFWIHFALLTKSGPGDVFMSLPFQVGLEGSRVVNNMDMPLEVIHGSHVAIQSLRDQNMPCFLHSHPFPFPPFVSGVEGEGPISSQQQQVTCYPYEDDNNLWAVELTTARPEGIGADEVVVVGQASIIRLRHLLTGKYLNSHDVVGPVSYEAQEVSCIGKDDVRVVAGSGPHDELWRVEVIGQTEGLLMAQITEFRLIHVSSNAALRRTGNLLPEWGFYQDEVVTDIHYPKDKSVLWKIQQNINMRLPNGPSVPLNPVSFIDKMVEIHGKMLQHNKILTSEHVYASHAWMWPFLINGVGYYHGPDNKQVFLLGNPLLWWSSAGLLIVYLLVDAALILRRQRHCVDLSPISLHRMTFGCRLLFLCWLGNYAPFFFMDRALFLHHYLPSSLFSILLSAAITGVVLDRNPESQSLVLEVAMCLIVVVVIGAFVYFLPLSHVTSMSRSDLESRQWLRTWQTVLN